MRGGRSTGRSCYWLSTTPVPIPVWPSGWRRPRSWEWSDVEPGEQEEEKREGLVTFVIVSYHIIFNFNWQKMKLPQVESVGPMTVVAKGSSCFHFDLQDFHLIFSPSPADKGEWDSNCMRVLVAGQGQPFTRSYGISCTITYVPPMTIRRGCNLRALLLGNIKI